MEPLKLLLQFQMDSFPKKKDANTKTDEKEFQFRKIMLSDVVVKKERTVYWGRRWTGKEATRLAVVATLHSLCVFAPSTFSWGAFWVGFGLYVVTGLVGITFSYHRNLTHRSFKLPKWLEYTCAYCGLHAVLGTPMDWVSIHRFHHQYCDTENDPHSPTEGFWFSHMSWAFDDKTYLEKCGESNNVADLEKQPFYRFLQRTSVVHPISLGALLYALGGFPYVVWGMGVRIVCFHHAIWLVNSVCHIWGNRAWNTTDLSRNNWWVAMLSFGEGWHNNHHAFAYSARHGLEWWQIDMTWYLVRLLQVIGLATHVRFPTNTHKQKMAYAN